ncbi:MAG: XRE family transcriptional regulator [Oscillospiraceae bacterium]|nr:XRE family transcriptional regulator [Oscillospiraceae bacterium]
MKRREEVIEQIEALAASRINDAVRLAFLTEEEMGLLDRLDLSAVTELKRNSNGTVELKFLDRLAALQWLLERAAEDPQAEKLYEALRDGAQQNGEAD